MGRSVFGPGPETDPSLVHTFLLSKDWCKKKCYFLSWNLMSNLNNESGQSFFARKQAIKPQIFGALKLQVPLPNADSKTLILKSFFTGLSTVVFSILF